MEEKFYIFDLHDVATPSFITAENKYFGYDKDIKKFTETNKYIKKVNPSPVKIIKECDIDFNGFIEWEHTNIWGFPYWLKGYTPNIEWKIVEYKKVYYLVYKITINKLMYCGPVKNKKWDNLSGGFWGLEGVLTYDIKKDVTSSNIWFKAFSDSDLKRVEEYLMKIIYQFEEDNPNLDVEPRPFTDFANQIFADG